MAKAQSSFKKKQRLQPARQLTLHNIEDHPHGLLVVIQAGNIAENLAAVFHESLADTDIDFFECLDTVCRKTGRQEHDPLHTLLCKLFNCWLAIGLQPFLRTKAGLEHHSQLFLIQPEMLSQKACCLGTMAIVGIALFQIFLWQTMEGRQNNLRLLIQNRQLSLDGNGKCLNVVRMIVVGLCTTPQRAGGAFSSIP